MDMQIVVDGQQGFMYQGRFSAILDLMPLREKIAAHLSFIRGEKNEDDGVVLPAVEFCLDSHQRN